MKCANCGNAHRASFRGCKRAPAYRIIATQNVQRPPRAPAPAFTINKGQFPKLPHSQLPPSQPSSYQPNQPPKPTAAEVLKKGTNKQAKPNQNKNNSKITNHQILQQMQATMQSMATMFASMCEMLGNQ